MQFTSTTQQLTTCPQCDNVVRIDAEFCNICGKRLRQSGSLSNSPTLSHLSPQEEEYEYIDEEEYEDEAAKALGVGRKTATLTPPIPPSPVELLTRLRHLQEQSAQIERYFP